MCSRAVFKKLNGYCGVLNELDTSRPLKKLGIAAWGDVEGRKNC